MGIDNENINEQKREEEKTRRLKFEFNNKVNNIVESEKKFSEIVEWENAAIETRQKMAEAIKSRNDLLVKDFQAMSKITNELRSTINQSFLVFSEVIGNLLSDIDWETINQELEDDARNVEKFLKEYEQDFWCVDMELFALIEDKELKFEEAPKYIEENLDMYIAEINKEPMYKFHATLISEAYEAYKAGLYKLCTFPLFATFEYVITSWYSGNINEDKQSIEQTKYVKGLRSNVHPKKYKNVEEDPTFKVFSLSVIRVYRKMFDTQYTSSKLNRNTIAHGLHDYDSLSKNDVLKLFQILKAATVLKVFDKNKLPIKKVAES
ncbi:hypothetical protein IIC_05296 [Bacillus cereus VD021]|uniref:Uncharacterized protein n=1 Tax=Bacillus cereus VD021 TaxID=1053224 RepID=R8H466_BACCE|nr:hypothetical protein [Bacillus cereus]EOO67657.1 hypothetical protein IIC_05296 [Bacillus cereus VD021]